MTSRKYFLGGNTAAGFYSCYHHFCTPEDGFLYVIKGGPGCGKSSFMRKIGAAAEKNGYDVEYVLCSGDPDSLDGIFIPQLKLGYMDGTAPHTADPTCPGVCGAYLDLGSFYDSDALQKEKDAILLCNDLYKGHYQKAYTILASHQGLFSDTLTFNGKARFHSAVTCRGIVDASPDADCATTTSGELAEILHSGAKYAVLHPLWPKRIVGAEWNGRLYLTDLQLPDLSEAVAELEKAKTIHDELEAFYNPHTDFAGVYKTAEAHIQKYL